MTTSYSTREEWLTAAIAHLADMFAEIGETVPAVRVSVGWPGGRGNKNSTIGQCWSAEASKDKKAQLFISPVLDDAERVLDVLAHELIHAIDNLESGHRGRFAKIAKAIGLEGPMTATHAGDVLKIKLAAISLVLGDYPHAAISLIGNVPLVPGQPVPVPPRTSGPKTQTTRMLKVECAEGSGYKVRMTRTWLEELGAPICPCHHLQMIEK